MSERFRVVSVVQAFFLAYVFHLSFMGSLVSAGKNGLLERTGIFLDAQF